MYAGTTLHRHSGNILGAHQRIDRIARKQLHALLPASQQFPKIADILHFEGNNGPDAMKRKSPSVDEPWHFIDPTKPEDTALLTVIAGHHHNLTTALTQKDDSRAAFEAAWVAHAIVDGLTPAHHYPLGDKIHELFGIPHDQRTSTAQKNIIRGESRRDTFSKNWQYWGSGGIFSAHISFEWGVATSMLGRRYPSPITQRTLQQVQKTGYLPYFQACLEKIDGLQLYALYQRKGWNRRVARLVHTVLIPTIISAVVIAWYTAAMEEASS